MIKHAAITLGPILAVVACTPAQQIDTQAELSALRNVAESYQQAASAKDAAAVVTFYADEAIMVPPNAQRVEGIENVRNYRFGFIETPGVELSFEIVRAEVSQSGDMGWTIALAHITIARPEGPPGRDLVRDFHVWKKQQDGSWKIVVDMWNSEPLTTP